ncbi:MAG: DUF58 domain-containing protein [Verrucomicrobiota bacterium]|nr:DUF58 domain-containing protein [Verrucomicrobiota bacterium]
MPSEADITREILKKVRQVEIRTRRQVTDALAGAYHSVFKGQGLNFEEVREYQPGDDVRSIDWNVTARMDKPFIKRFREEREMTLILAVDLSGSGRFGSRVQSKRELAAEFASVIAFSAARNSDRVGLLLFSSEVETYIPPAKGTGHILRIIREVLFRQPKKHGTDLTHALDNIARLQRKRAVVFVISDFLQESLSLKDDGLPGGATWHALRIASRRHDVICVELHDRREAELPDAGILVLEDAETGNWIEVDTSRKSVRTAYRQLNEQRRTRLHRALRQLGIDQITISTGDSYQKALRGFFENRSRRR